MGTEKIEVMAKTIENALTYNNKTKTIKTPKGAVPYIPMYPIMGDAEYLILYRLLEEFTVLPSTLLITYTAIELAKLGLHIESAYMSVHIKNIEGIDKIGFTETFKDIAALESMKKHARHRVMKFTDKFNIQKIVDILKDIIESNENDMMKNISHTFGEVLAAKRIDPNMEYNSIISLVRSITMDSIYFNLLKYTESEAQDLFVNLRIPNCGCAQESEYVPKNEYITRI